MIKNIENIIEYENEHSCLDFKKSQYVKEKHGDLLKDVIAMANAIADGNKFIIIGVKHFPDGTREIHPIKNSDFVDSATYQQLIRENIEPDLHIEYEPYEYKEGLIGIFHLTDCNNPPYLLKKDFGTLKKGDCLIRKGSHQSRINRSDLDKIYDLNNKKSKFLGSVDIGFLNTNCSQKITLSPLSSDGLPSQKAANKICEILENRKLEKQSQEIVDYQHKTIIPSIIPSYFSKPTTYEERSNETLQKNLNNIYKTYREDDLHEIMEIRSFNLNFEIFNHADEYLQDASVKIEIPRNKSYKIAKHIFKKPDHNPSYMKIIAINKSGIIRYPNIEYSKNKIIIHKDIGDIKHKMTTKVFDCDIRLAVMEVPEDGIIPIDFKLFSKNLPHPIHKKLIINVIARSS